MLKQLQNENIDIIASQFSFAPETTCKRKLGWGRLIHPTLIFYFAPCRLVRQPDIVFRQDPLRFDIVAQMRNFSGLNMMIKIALLWEMMQ